MHPKYNKMRRHCLESRKKVVFIFLKELYIQHLLSQMFFANFAYANTYASDEDIRKMNKILFMI